MVSYYFGGKEQMLRAILDEDEGPTFGPLMRLAAMDLPAVEKLELYVSGVRDFLGAIVLNVARIVG